MTENPIQPPGEVPPEAAMPPCAMIQPGNITPSTGMASGPTGHFVVDRYETSVGSFMFLLTPEQAKAHGEDLIRRGTIASTGLTLPPGVRL